MPSLTLEAGDATGELVTFITTELDDEALDQVTVERELAPASGLASEPVTIGAVITLGSVVALSVARIVERWLEGRRQATAMKLVIEGFTASSEAGQALAKLAEKHAQVSVKFGPPTAPEQPK